MSKAALLYRVEHRLTAEGPYRGQYDGCEAAQAAKHTAATRARRTSRRRMPLASDDCVANGQALQYDIARWGEAWALASTPRPRSARKIAHNLACAFTTIEQLLDWFDADELALLYDAGFAVHEIEVKAGAPIAHGVKQTVCRRDDIARRVALTFDDVIQISGV